MNAWTRRDLEAPTRHGFTGDDVLRMMSAGVLYEGGRFELIDGEIIDMPAEGDVHLSLKISLNRFLARALPDAIALTPDGTLRLSESNWPEPDFYLFPAAMRVSEVRGPDLLLVIELSDSTLAYDLRRKAELYRRFGVREYWVADVKAGATHVHHLGGAWPSRPVLFTDELEASLIPALRLRLADFLPPS
ncbi:MAG TPA: Uma2 family endonuclease [Caulobacteraceae bacterium]|jgi:Uma2 family endonuclease